MVGGFLKMSLIQVFNLPSTFTFKKKIPSAGDVSVTSVSVAKTPALSDKDVNVTEDCSFVETSPYNRQTSICDFKNATPGLQTGRTGSKPLSPDPARVPRAASSTTQSTPVPKESRDATFKKLEFSSSSDSFITINDWDDMDDFDTSGNSKAFFTPARNHVVRVSTAQKSKKPKDNFLKAQLHEASSGKADLTLSSSERKQGRPSEERKAGSEWLSGDVICIDDGPDWEEFSSKDTQGSPSVKLHWGEEKGKNCYFISILIYRLYLFMQS